jgi:RNA polymerase sigma factor (sigma-70 family)
MEGLTKKVLAFQRSRDGLGALVEELSLWVYRYPRFKLGWDEDACGEFYLYFYPRLIRLLSRFRDQGKPFESYLFSVLSWQLKNFARERRRMERGWNVALRLGRRDEDENGPDPVGEAQEPSPFSCPAWPADTFQGAADRRNLLILGLKSLRSLTPEGMAALSRLTGVPITDISRHSAALRIRLEPRERRLEGFRQRRNRAYSQVQTLESELSDEIDLERREVILDRLSKARKRMKTAIEKMSRIMVNPTNREIAEVLGVPKGTVDSGLYWLKRKLSVVYYSVNRQSA